jgi:hypothetical protein
MECGLKEILATQTGIRFVSQSVSLSVSQCVSVRRPVLPWRLRFSRVPGSLFGHALKVTKLSKFIWFKFKINIIDRSRSFYRPMLNTHF